MWYPTDHPLGLRRNGVNHVGLETPFRNRPEGYTEPVQRTTYPLTSTALLEEYAKLGMRSARVVFSWESVQKNPDPLPRPFVAASMGAVPFNTGGFGKYWTDLTKLVIRLIDKGLYVIVAAWQYNKNANNGSGDTDITYNEKSFDKEHFADFWGKFATAINQAVAGGFPPDPPELEIPANPNRPGKLAFDLINEPHAPPATPNGTVGITVGNWVAYAQAAIDKIRANPANTNTIFVQGMGYGSVRRDAHLSNPADPASPLLWELLKDPLKRIGISAHCYDATVKRPGELPSAKPIKALANACADLVDFARKKEFKLHIGEIAVDAGVSACGTLATAKDQWKDWNQFCLENDDVLVGWNWWGNTSKTWGWSLDGSCSESRTWALTQDDGNTWSPYVDVMQDQDSIPVPELVIRDNTDDAGTEPNLTTTIAFESPDIWVRNIVGDEVIVGGTSAVVFVRVTNRGDRDYPGTGNDIVALYWAKASTALSIPEPWNGKVGGVEPNPKPGGLVGSGAIGAVPKKNSTMISIPWEKTPNPADYPVKDGHFCLLAVVAKNFNPLAQVTHEGLEAPLSASVLKMNNVGWHNIHIDAPKPGGGMMKLGAAVLGNPGSKAMRASLRLEVLDARARPVNPRPGSLRITLEGAALERLGRMEARRPVWEDMGDGSFAVLDSADAMPELTLQPGETLPVELSYAADRRDRGYAVRAIQYEREGAVRRLVGGQTFVVGAVEGFTLHRRPLAKHATWPWLVALGALFVLIATLGGRPRPRRWT